MARPREFDPDAVLERAMTVFWSNGYEATSLNDLCEATQLNRSSLYATFGDKHALFLETIDRYGDRAVARVTAALSRPVPIREAMAAFLEDMIDGIIAGPGKDRLLYRKLHRRSRPARSATQRRAYSAMSRGSLPLSVEHSRKRSNEVNCRRAPTSMRLRGLCWRASKGSA